MSSFPCPTLKRKVPELPHSFNLGSTNRNILDRLQCLQSGTDFNIQRWMHVRSAHRLIMADFLSYSRSVSSTSYFSIGRATICFISECAKLITRPQSVKTLTLISEINSQRMYSLLLADTAAFPCQEGLECNFLSPSKRGSPSQRSAAKTSG